MDDHDGCGFLVVVGLLIIVGAVALCVGYNNGHDTGVRDGISGRYVVVELPDGTSQVVSVKAKEATKQ